MAMTFRDFWGGLAPRARAGLIGGTVAIALAFAVAAATLLKTDYQVLFADLKPQDAAAMAAELDRMKLPYKLAGDGTTLLVDAKVVHATRLKLMGKDLPLHGAAGFEIFNNADFGLTEFAQKINYQRALQGEITRTILSLHEVRDVRVHLVLPEEGLFKKSVAKATAAITLSLKEGQTLRPEQVTGIQRLVSSAVPGMLAQNVTIVNDQGVALTRAAASDTPQELGSARLELKAETERLLARKATDVLEGVFGAGQALARVDATLNMDQVRVTTEDVLGDATRTGRATGVIVRERESDRDMGPPLGSRGEASTRGGSSQREVDYQVGRRVEQVATQPGAIRRLHVVAMVRQALDDRQLDQMRTMVGAAVGAAAERGDTVVVQSLAAFVAPPASPAAATARADEAEARPGTPAAPSTVTRTSSADDDRGSVGWMLLTMGVLLVGLAGTAWTMAQRGARQHRLSAQDRERLLGQMREWLDEGRVAGRLA
jgi:flagellar M-ring protein FliF